MHFDENRYPGVNAHLNSLLLQPDGGWESFHANWVIQVQHALDAVLPPNYYAMAEKSLQISEVAAEVARRSRPDVSVYRTGTQTDDPVPAVGGQAPSAVVSLNEVLDEMVDVLTSVGVYHMVTGGVPGKLVTRLEILSPGNKPPATYAPQYLARRYETLKAGVNLVEIDLVHTRRPVTVHVPSYPDRQPEATPSVVMVSHLETGQFRIYAVPLPEPLPQVAVPLAGEAFVVLDLQAVYNQTFANTRVFPLLVDYAADPVGLDHYHEADQAWIADFLAALRTES